jgi:hypothetical protein
VKKPFDAAKYVDRTGTWHAPVGLRIPIKVLGARSVFGRVELHVSPIHGEGKAWVKLPYVKLAKFDPSQHPECEENPPTNKHEFTVDLEYDSTGDTKTCCHCGALEAK